MWFFDSRATHGLMHFQEYFSNIMVVVIFIFLDSWRDDNFLIVPFMFEYSLVLLK